MKTLTITFLLTFLLTIGTANSDVTPVTDRTQAVQDAIVAAVPNIDAAVDVTETHLTAITNLNLRNKGITELQSGDFSGLTGLTNLNLYGNELSSLPDGIFEDLTALTTLRLGSNSVDPMPLIVTLQKTEDDQFKAVMSTGAPFDITLPINTTNNGATSEATTITIPIGNVESALFTVTTTNPSGTPIVAIGTLPGLPRNHYGYTFALSTACHRTLQVRRAIVAAVPGVDDCRDVTDAHLAAIQTLSLEGAGISTLSSDDFSGLTSLRTLYLGNNNLTTLPADIFSGLSNLRDLYIQNNKLNSLPEDVFSSLSSIRQLNLHSNQLTSLPKNLFSGLNSLTQIYLNDNQLTTLDPDIFSNVSTLRFLFLNNNRLTTLPENLFSKITSLEQLLLNNNRLGNLPPGIFRGLSTPTLLWIHANAVNPIPLTISLEKVGETQFKVTVPAGAPFDIDLSLTVTNGSITGGINSTTITAGSVESDPFTVTRTPGVLDAVTVDIGTLPGLPTNHLGYNLVKLNDLPLVVISGVNRAPVFTEGASTTRSVAENTAANVHIGTAVVATDVDNDTLTYTLGGTDAASFEIVSATGRLKTKTTLDYETKNAYTVMVIVSDGSFTDTINVNITVTDIDETIPNRAPVFTEGDSTVRIVAENTEAGVHIGDTVAATDPDGNTLAYTLGGTDATAFEIDSATGQLKTKATLDYETKNAYSVTIAVSDGSLTDTINVTINISNLNDAPMFTEGGSTTRKVAEKTLEGVEIGTAIVATDADKDTLTYTLGGTDANIFEVDNTTGQLKTKKTLDFESQFTYKVTLTVSDGSLSDTIDVTITVTDIDETIPNRAPVFADGNSTTRSVAENTAADTDIGTAIAATDPDGNTLIYTLGGTDAATFDIDSTSGQLKTKAELNYETKKVYTLTITVSDGSLTDTINVTINITDIEETIPNRAPVFTEGETTTRAVAENTAADTNIGTAVAATDADNDTLTYTLSGTDAASFAIISTSGQLKTSVTLDFETKSSYSVTVSVSDGKGGTDSINVTINVTDIVETIPNRAPVFTEGETTTRAVAENTAADTNIGTAVAATDADNDTLTYTLGGTDSVSFAIVGTSGQLKTSAALDFETKSSYSVTVSVSDGKGGTDSINVTINVTDIVETIPNRVPVFTEGETTTRAVAENTVGDTNIGAAVGATDADNNTLTYTLGGTDAATFDIDSTSGQLKTKAELNYETKKAYTLTITASDGSLTDVINVNINVTNENDAPIFTEGNTATRAIAENTETGANIGTVVAATDPDGNTLTYTLGGTDADVFAIDNATGQLKTKATLDYETKKTYSVTITASDGSLKDTITVTINITDIVENRVPVFTEGNSATRSIAENTNSGVDIGTAVSATDEDNDTLTYTLGGTDAASFAIVGTSGQLKTSASLDYEDKTSYSVTITVSDGKGGTDSISVTITVTDVTENRAPVFTDGENTTRSVAENTATDINIGTAVAATDADNDTLTYTLGGTDATSFAIVGTSGQLKTSASLDYEDKTSYSVTITVSDGKGGTDSISVTITVTDVTENRAPVFTDGENTTRSVAENTTTDTNIGTAVAATDADNDTLTYTLSGTDAISFAIENTTGHLKTKATLNYETKSSYLVTVSVSDDNGGSDSISVTITVTDITQTTFTAVCNRTPQVRDALVAAAGVDDCSQVTEEHLAVIRTISLPVSNISSLKSGDFGGLSNLRTLILFRNDLSSLPSGIFDDLTSLIDLNISFNDLSSLPSGIFDDLTTLKNLDLTDNELSSLPAGIFDELDNLESLTLINNELSSLSAGIFDELDNLRGLSLNDNELSSLPESIFDELNTLINLNLSSNDLSSLPSGIFDELTALLALRLDSNDLTSLPDGIFDGLTALTGLDLSSNDLSSLPSGIFDRLTALTTLKIQGNTVDPFPFTVSLEKVSDGQFKAVAPTGAPFDIVLPLTVANGSISGSATNVTISIGAVESDTLTVTRTSGTTGAVTVDIGTLPSIPSSHNGYALVKPTTGLPLEVIATVGGAPTSVSNTAPQVPEVTAVMPNYPNPFNPETWIPYQLAKSADVSLTFYNIHGVVVRRLVLGHRAAGVYYSRSRAAHWDGRNNIGEKVATGTYFCTFTAGDFITTRKMVIRK